MNCSSCGDALTETSITNGFRRCLACDTAEPSPAKPFVFTDILDRIIASGRPVRVGVWRRFPKESP